MDPDKTPYIPLELLTWLEGRFPERSASRNDQLPDLMFAGGQRDVIRFLRSQHEQQVEGEMAEKTTINL